jgi:putative endonuclease
MSAYTYLLRCSDGTLYCGWTDNIEKRLAAHNSGKASKYTRSRLPVKLVYFETFDTKQEAMSREARIKQLSRREKLALINPPRD